MPKHGPYGTNIRCPRCKGGIPTDEKVGEYPGALSRYDNSTEICSACGEREAMWHFYKPDTPLPPPDQEIDTPTISSLFDDTDDTDDDV